MNVQDTYFRTNTQMLADLRQESAAEVLSALGCVVMAKKAALLMDGLGTALAASEARVADLEEGVERTSAEAERIKKLLREKKAEMLPHLDIAGEPQRLREARTERAALEATHQQLEIQLSTANGEAGTARTLLIDAKKRCELIEHKIAALAEIPSPDVDVMRMLAESLRG